MLVLLTLGLLLGGLVAVYWIGSALERKRFSASATGLLVLEDCDADFRTPPFEDAIITFGANGKPVRKVTGLNIAETVGGCRSLSVAKDGRFFTVCENVAQKLTAHQLDTGKRLWSLDGAFNSATISQNGTVYALTSSGTIYGKDILLIDQNGRIVRQAPVGGFDLALDDERKVLWLAGKNIKKCDLDCKQLFEINCIGWCAVSLDVSLDGSVWVAKREHPNVVQSTNRLLKLSSEGQMLKAIGLPFSPSCVRVDSSDGSIWATGVVVQESAIRRLLDATERRIGRLPIGNKIRELLTGPRVWFRTRKYDQNGGVLCEVRQGGFSLEIDQADGSLWIGGRQKVYHYSRRGTILGQGSGISPDQKYVAIVPERREHKP